MTDDLTHACRYCGADCECRSARCSGCDLCQEDRDREAEEDERERLLERLREL